jgi:hypothetical protein
MRAPTVHGVLGCSGSIVRTHLICARIAVGAGTSRSSTAVVFDVIVCAARAGHGGAINASRITTGGAGGRIGSGENIVSWPAFAVVDRIVSQPLCAAATTSVRRTRG